MKWTRLGPDRATGRRRRALGVALAATLAFTAASCGGDDDDSATDASATELTADGEQPTATGSAEGGDAPPDGSDDTFVVGIGGDPETLNAAAATGAAAQIGGMVYDGLVSGNSDLSEMRPELAESWDISDDGLTYTFNLRQGVTWHDGTPFTSADVVWSLENINVNHTVGRQYIPFIESMETPDDHTVVITLNAPYGPFLISLATNTGGAIVPKHIGEQAADPLTDETLNRAPIGTGPFVFDEWTPGQELRFHRNPNYWGVAPAIDELIFRIIPDASARILSIQNGDVDWIDEEWVDRSFIADFEDDPDVQIITETVVPSVLLILPNHLSEPLGDVAVRQALYMAIDREFIKEAVTSGFSIVPETMIDSRLAPSATDAPEASLTGLYPYDPDAAAALLDEAGYPADSNGVRFELDISYEGGRLNFDDLVDAVRAMWGEIGVVLNAQPSELAVSMDKVFMQRDFDLMLTSYNTFSEPAIGVARYYRCEPFEEARNYGNPTDYCNPEVDALLEAGLAESDIEERRPIYAEVQALLAAELPLFPVSGTTGAGLSNRSWDVSVAINDYYRGTSGAAWVHIVPAD